MSPSDLIKKVILWRLISIFITLMILYVVTGDAKSATGITLLLHVVLTACHYTFEKCWAKLYESR